MPTKKERQIALIAKMQANIDEGAAQIAALDTAIAASNTAITTIQAEIATLTAIANRNATQNLELRSLRKDLDLWRALRDSQQLCKKLVRNDITTSRYGLFLDGSARTVRSADLDGGE
jgi:uncharacterized protein YhaN